MSEIRTVIFDLDGTLIDTEPAAVRAIHDCFREWGLEINPEDAQYITGRMWSVAIEYLFKKYPIPMSPAQATRLISSAYHRETQAGVDAVVGAPECVLALAADFPLALVTGSGRKATEWALGKLGIRSHFKHVFTAED